jgi:hypothetical protein
VKECRHRDLKVAQRYQADALAVKKAILENPELSKINVVDKFTPNIVHGEGNNMKRALSPLTNRLYFNDIHEVARYFAEKQLNVHPGDSNYMNWRFLLNKSYGLPMGPGLRHDRPLWNQITKHVPPQDQANFIMAYHAEIDATREAGRLQGRREARQTKRSNTTTATVAMPPAKKTKTDQHSTNAANAVRPTKPPNDGDVAASPVAVAVIEDDDIARQRTPPSPLPLEALDMPNKLDDGEILTSTVKGNARFLPVETIALINQKCENKEEALAKLHLMDRLAREIMDLPADLFIREDPVARFVAGKQVLLGFTQDAKDKSKIIKFFSRTLLPVVRCLHGCHSGNVESFHKFLCCQPQFKFRSSEIIRDNHCQTCTALRNGKPAAGPKPKT